METSDPHIHPAVERALNGSARAILLRFTGKEAAENALNLASTISAAGFDPLVVPIWHDGIQWPQVEQLSLIDGEGLENVERLSAYAFRQRYGYELDLFDLMAHTYAIRDIRSDSLLAESVWCQKLRGVAVRAHDLITRTNPEVIFVTHGAEVISRIVAVVASNLGRKTLYWESPFFRGYHFVDPIGPHFFRNDCRLDVCCAADLRLDGALRTNAISFMESWRQNRLSKYEHSTDIAASTKLKAWRTGRPHPVLFIAGHLAHIGNVAVSLGSHMCYEDSLQSFVLSVPAHWQIVFKPHPKDVSPERWNALLEERAVVAHQVDIHDVFPCVDTVATLSSNVGLEALIVGLPVIVWGQPVYARRGLTHDLTLPEDVSRLLSAGIPPGPDADRVTGLIGRIVYEGLTAHGDGDKLKELISAASSRAPKSRLAWYGKPVQDIALAARNLDRQLYQSSSITRALSLISVADRTTIDRAVGNTLVGHTHGGPVAPVRPET